MKRAARVCVIGCVVFTFAIVARGRGSSVESLCKECSRYSFHSFNSNESDKSWNKAVMLCRTKHSADLASMESEMEWKVVTSYINSQTVGKETEWYIGLRKNKKLNAWCWLSNNKTCINSSQKGTWRWQAYDPSGDGCCVNMAKNYPAGYFGRYNDLKCDTQHPIRGYMCEEKVDCSDRDTSSSGYLLQWNITCQSTVHPSLKTEKRITVVTTKPVSEELLPTTEPKNKSRYTESAETVDQSTTTNLVTEALTSGTVPGSQAHSTNTSLQRSDPTEALTPLYARPSSYDPRATNKSTSAVLVIILSVVVLLIIAVILVGVVVFFWRKRNRNINYQGMAPIEANGSELLSS